MKKKSHEQLHRELLLGQQHHRLALKRKSKTYNPNKPPEFRHLFTGHIISAPEIISIYNISIGEIEEFVQTVSFVKEILKHFGRKKCVLDFTKTRQIKAAAQLYVYAALEIARTNGDEPATILYSQASTSVNYNLRKRNFKKIIENKSSSIKYDFKNIVKLPVISSYSNQFMEDILDFIRDRIFDKAMPPEAEHIYGDAVSETINNVGFHAYPRKNKLQKKWWLLLDVHGHDLYLAIYDHGVGIPETVIDKTWFLSSLKHSYPKEYEELESEFPETQITGLKKYMPHKLKDEQLIYLSMQGDVTRTRAGKHGQGSKSIKALVSETDQAKLWVFSNKGLYIFENEDAPPEIHSLPDKLPGTLIQWKIKIT